MLLGKKEGMSGISEQVLSRALKTWECITCHHTDDKCFGDYWFLDGTWMHFNGHYYIIDTEYRTWHQARENCKTVGTTGSDLVVIDSEEEQNFLNRKFHGYISVK